MNQFNNIGSMFPGAEHKLTRDKAKELLTLNASRKITGLIFTDPDGNVTLVDKGGVMALDPVNLVANERQRCHAIAHSEYEYWNKACDDDPGGYGIEGMGAAANIVCSILLGYTAEEHNAKKTELEGTKEALEKALETVPTDHTVEQGKKRDLRLE